MSASRPVTRKSPTRATTALERRKPRSFEEWRALRSWRRLPAWEADPPGYLLRLAREEAGCTQAVLADRLGVSQQAVAQAERWESNPTVAFLRSWAEALGSELELRLRPARPRRGS
jgi:DNA-binding XRE family transcriptional regulator